MFESISNTSLSVSVRSVARADDLVADLFKISSNIVAFVRDRFVGAAHDFLVIAPYFFKGDIYDRNEMYYGVVENLHYIWVGVSVAA